MALHDPDEQYEAALMQLTSEKAYMILAALKAGGKLNTQDMIERLGAYLGDDHALAEVIRLTAQGRNAFGELLQKLALDAGEEQARAELAEAPRRRREQARLDQFAPVPI